MNDGSTDGQTDTQNFGGNNNTGTLISFCFVFLFFFNVCAENAHPLISQHIHCV